MKIVDVRPTTVTIPLEAPLRHSNGVHWGRFVRTIVEVETDEGIVGVGELGGGGESAELAFQGLKQYLIGHDPFQLEALRFKISKHLESGCRRHFARYDVLGRHSPLFKGSRDLRSVSIGCSGSFFRRVRSTIGHHVTSGRSDPKHDVCARRPLPSHSG